MLKIIKTPFTFIKSCGIVARKYALGEYIPNRIPLETVPLKKHNTMVSYNLPKSENVIIGYSAGNCIGSQDNVFIGHTSLPSDTVIIGYQPLKEK